MARPRDTVTIESVRGGDASVVVDRATQYELITSLQQPSCARFELGDDGTWAPLEQIMAIGGRYIVSVNGRPRITGRMLTRNLPISASGGATVQLVVRTLLADAEFTTVDAAIGVRNTTLKDVILAAFRKLGLTEKDFVFRGDVARDLITGRKSGQPSAGAGIRAEISRIKNQPMPAGTSGQAVRHRLQLLEQKLAGAETRPVLPELQEIKLEEARPQPPESVRAFVDRHLSRFGLIMWDGADGRIVVAKPDDSQNPLFIMTCLRGPGSAANNLTNLQKTEDFEGVPGNLWVFGQGGGKDQTRAKIKYREFDEVIASVDPPLERTVTIIDESIKTQAQAEARARRELFNRSLQKDSWTLDTDGLSYWNGSQSIPYGINCVADVRVDLAGAASGAYLIYQCTMRGSAGEAHTTQMLAVGRGIWNL